MKKDDNNVIPFSVKAEDFDDMFKGIDEMEMIKEAEKKAVQHKPKIIKFKR